MDVEVFFDPVFHIVIKNVFTEKENQEIFEEAIKNEKHFEKAVTYGGLNEDLRNNKAAYYDDIYNKNRYDSVLLRNIDSLFRDMPFQSLVNSSPYPLNLFSITNYHETQVSRYGNNGQKYVWHLDNLANSERQITVVYYFNKTPTSYKGGEINFTNSPLMEDVPIIKNPTIKSIKPENNMMVIFSSYAAHSVSPTTSPDKFEDGRFSANIWIGMR